MATRATVRTDAGDMPAYRRLPESETTFHTDAGADHAFDNADLPALHHLQASAAVREPTRDWLTAHLR